MTSTALVRTGALPMVPPGASVAERGPVLVGDDGSDHARPAVRHAAALAQRLGRDLIRMNVDAGHPVQAISDAGRAQQACLVIVGPAAEDHCARRCGLGVHRPGSNRRTTGRLGARERARLRPQIRPNGAGASWPRARNAATIASWFRSIRVSASEHSHWRSS
jgi:nucleotide-binding universal stress UspA family protein